LLAAVLWPGEVYHESRALAFALILSAALLQPPSRWGWPVVPMVVLGGAAAFGAAPDRSLRTLLPWLIALVAGTICAGLPRPEQRIVLAVLAIAGVALALFGIHQRFWGFASDLEQLERLAADPRLAAAARDRIASGRVYATYALPTTLAGVLAALLPLQAACLLAADRRRRWLWGLGIALTGATLLATGSFGGPLALVLALLLVDRRRSTWWIGLVATLAGAILLLSIQRGFWPWDWTYPAHPLALRAQHWRSALELAGRHPLGAIGPGNFEVAVAAIQQPRAPTSRYAHSAPLQLLSEAGVWGVLAIGLLARAGQRAFARRHARPGLTASCWAIALHNAADIGFYFDSIALLTGTLFGLALAQDRPVVDRERARPIPRLRFAGLLGVVVLEFASNQAQFQAHRALELEDLAAARAALDRALMADPWSAEARRLEATLVEWSPDAAARERAWAGASAVDPWRASNHARRALALLALDRPFEALGEARIAAERFPLRQGPFERRLAASIRAAARARSDHP
jgi:hypothetical protein